MNSIVAFQRGEWKWDDLEHERIAHKITSDNVFSTGNEEVNGPKVKKILSG